MRTLITGLGEIVSGDIEAPLLDADSILMEDGRIAAVGRGIDEDADVVIDGKGATAFPGRPTPTSPGCSATGRRASARPTSSSPSCMAA